MSHYVNLEMSYSTYSKICDAVESAATNANDFDEISEWIHLSDFLEEEYERDCAKQNSDYQTWKLYEKLFQNKEIYHHQYFHNVKSVFDDYEDRDLLEWNISQQDKFHLICELIDVFKKDIQIKR